MGVGGVLAAVGVAVEDERAVVEEAGVGELQPRASCRPRLKPAQLCTPAPWSGHRAPSDDDEDDAPGSPVAALLETHGGDAAREAEADDDDADATDDARDAEHVSEADASGPVPGLEGEVVPDEKCDEVGEVRDGGLVEVVVAVAAVDGGPERSCHLVEGAVVHLRGSVHGDESGPEGEALGLPIAVDGDEHASVVLDADVPWVPREHGAMGGEVGEATVDSHPTSLSAGGLVEEAQAAEP